MSDRENIKKAWELLDILRRQREALRDLRVEREPRFFIGDHECKPLMLTINMTGPDGPERKVYVSPEHPRLYELARAAEESGDRQTMRAIVAAAKRATKP